MEDVVSTSDIPTENSPYPGERATRVGLRADAVVNFVHTRSLRQDPFDLNVRVRAKIARREGWP